MIIDNGNKTWAGEWLLFKDEGLLSKRSKKTHRYAVRSKTTGDQLGDVVWKNQWRTYVFRTLAGRVAWLDFICLTEIAEFVNMMTVARKSKWPVDQRTQPGGGRATVESPPISDVQDTQDGPEEAVPTSLAEPGQ